MNDLKDLKLLQKAIVLTSKRLPNLSSSDRRYGVSSAKETEILVLNTNAIWNTVLQIKGNTMCDTLKFGPTAVSLSQLHAGIKAGDNSYLDLVLWKMQVMKGLKYVTI